MNPPSLAPNATSPSASQAPSHQSPRFTPLDPLRIVRQYMWLFVIVFLVAVVFSVVLSLMLSKMAPQYTSKSQLVVRSPIQEAYQAAVEVGGSSGQRDALSTFILNQLLRIKSQTILLEALKNVRVKQTQWFRKFGDDQKARYENLNKYLTVSSSRGSSVILVSFTGREANDLADILETVVSTYLNIYKRDQEEESGGIRRQMVREKERALEQKQIIVAQLEAFRVEHDLPKLRVEGTEAEIKYRMLVAQVTDLDLQLGQLQQLRRDFQSDLNAPQINLRPGLSSQLEQMPSILQRQNNLTNMNQQLKQLLGLVGENHTSVKTLKSNIAVLSDELNRMKHEQSKQLIFSQLDSVETQMKQVYLNIESLKPDLDSARDKLQDMDTKLQRYRVIEEQLEAETKRYNRADLLLEDLRIRAGRSDAMRVIVWQSPTVAEMTFPNHPVMIMGVTLLLIGSVVGVVFLKELLDQRIKSPADLALLANTTLLGILPDMQDDPSLPDKVEGIVARDPTGLFAENYRQVRTEITSRMNKRGYKSLLLVGAHGGCGTTTVVGNLATSLVHNGLKVVVIDANFRRPCQCKLFGIDSSSQGLVELVNGSCTLDQARVINPDGCGVDVIPTGQCKKTPPELLDSQAFSQLITDLEAQYDIILVDAPPMLVASDGKLITKQVDAVVMVVRARSEKRGLVGRMLRELEGQRADQLGVVLNGLQISAGGYLRSNYKAYYRYRENGAKNTPSPVKSA